MLLGEIESKSAVIGVLGLGYVGLPLAAAFAQAGFEVIGFDIQESRVNSITKGESYIPDVSSTMLKQLVKHGKLRATTDMSSIWLRHIDIAIVCVPTPVTEAKHPDLSYITKTLCSLRDGLLFPDKLVVLESSTYPGTTRELVMPLLEGRARFLAYSPERIDPGSTGWSTGYDIKNTPKLVGGIDEESTRLAALLYSQIVDTVVPVSSPEVAEMVKLFENVFRNVNIALVNEMAMLCEELGVSVWEMIDAAATKPFGYMPFYPGPGVGGHCIPVDPYYVMDRALKCNFYAGLVSTALGLNESMPKHVARRVEGILHKEGKRIKESKILVLGVAFKKNVGDTRGSPVLVLMQELQGMGSTVSYNDPHVPEVTLGSTVWLSESLEKIVDADCVIIATDHDCYDFPQIVKQAKVVFDARGATRHLPSGNIYRLGEKG